MTVRGGDIRQFKIGGRELDPTPEAEYEFVPSGFQNEHRPTGNGRLTAKSIRTLAMIDGITVLIDNIRGDLEYLQGVRDGGEPVAVNCTLADGTAWTGSMGIEGELRYNAGSGECTFQMRGARLEQI